MCSVLSACGGSESPAGDTTGGDGDGDGDAGALVVVGIAGGDLLSGEQAVGVDATGGLVVEGAIELLVDGAVVASDDSAPFEFVWQTDSVDDGAHVVTARAIIEGAQVTSDEVAVTVDNTAPAAAQLSPVPGSREVLLTQTFELQATEPLSPDSVVEVRDDAGAVVPATVAIDGAAISIDVTAPPTGYGDFSVDLDGVTDRAGNALELSQPWTFSVPVLRAPVAAPAAANAAYEVTGMALDSLGRPVIAANVFAGGAPRPEVLGYDGTTWTSLGSLVGDPNSAEGTAARLAIDAQDRPVAAWLEAGATGQTKLYVARYESGSWNLLNAGTRRSSAFESDMEDPAIAVDGAGNIFVAWSENPSDQPNDAVVYAELYDGTSWTLIADGLEFFTVGNSGADQVQVTFGPGGTPWLLWRERLGGESLRAWAFVAQYSGVGTGWVARGDQLGNGPFFVDEPGLVFDADDRPVVTWSEYDTQRGIVPLYALRLEAGEWKPLGTPLNAEVAEGVEATQGRPAVGADGVLRIAWVEEGSNGKRVYVARLESDEWIIEPGALVAPGQVDPDIESLRFAVGARGPVVGLSSASDGEGAVAFVAAANAPEGE